jgi:hypothetical protein
VPAKQTAPGPTKTEAPKSNATQRTPERAARVAGEPTHENPTVTTRQGIILPPTLYGPLAQAEQPSERPARQITINLKPSNDLDLDKRRIKAVYGTLISFHGKDRFSFQIFEGGRGHLLDFPSDNTNICPALLERLKKVVGEESWRIEEITFQ